MSSTKKPAFVDRSEYETGRRDDHEWKIEHFEARLHELMQKGAHRTHPWITERYENDLTQLYKSYRAADE